MNKNKVLDAIVYRLNPQNDFNNIKFFNSRTHKKDPYGQTLYGLGALKSMLRGGVAGGLVGLVLVDMMGENKYVFYGVMSGLCADIGYYGVRGVYHYLKQYRNL